MKRPNVNFIVDSLGFSDFVLLAATGALMRHVPPPSRPAGWVRCRSLLMVTSRSAVDERLATVQKE